MAFGNDDIVVRDIAPTQFGDAVGVLARGMRDNPLHVAAYGADPKRRRRCHGRLMRGVLTVFESMQLVGAVDGTLVGVAGMAPAGTCQPTFAQRIRMLSVVAGLGPLTAARVFAWTSTWAKHDLDEPHVHLGPVAVDVNRQGQGIGSRIMTECCRRLDAAGAVGYLETDKQVNVTFYERFGFEVIGGGQVLSVPNWYLRRAPSSAGSN